MDTTHIKHKLSVNEKPCIIIPAEGEYQVFPVINSSLCICNCNSSVFRDQEILFHAHSKMIIHGFHLIQQIDPFRAFICCSPYAFILKTVKWQETSSFIAPSVNTKSLVILVDLICPSIIACMVQTALITVFIGSRIIYKIKSNI